MTGVAAGAGDAPLEPEELPSPLHPHIKRPDKRNRFNIAGPVLAWILQLASNCVIRAPQLIIKAVGTVSRQRPPSHRCVVRGAENRNMDIMPEQCILLLLRRCAQSLLEPLASGCPHGTLQARLQFLPAGHSAQCLDRGGRLAFFALDHPQQEVNGLG